MGWYTVYTALVKTSTPFDHDGFRRFTDNKWLKITDLKQEQDQLYRVEIILTEKYGGRGYLDGLVCNIKDFSSDVIDIKAKMSGEDGYAEMQLDNIQIDQNPINYKVQPVKLA